MFERPEEIRRILAIRLDNIGDVIMLSPALRALRQNFPAAHITLMVSPAGSAVAPMLPWADELLVYRSVWQDASWAMPLDPAREVALIQDLHRREFDAAFIFTSFSQSPYPPAYACYLAGIPIRTGQSKEFGGSVLSHWVKPLADPTHQVDRNLHLLSSAGLALAGQNMELRIPTEAMQAADSALREKGIEPGAPFIVAAPGASAEARRYDIARFASAVRGLAVSSSLPIVVIGSAREQKLLGPVLAAHSGVISLVGQTSIPELAAVIYRSRLLIGNNSGPMHMADALGRPIVALYSGTEYETQWQPRFSPVRLLRRPTDCSPCYAFKCPYHMECLDIEPSAVVEAALDLLHATEKEVVG